MKPVMLLNIMVKFLLVKQPNHRMQSYVNSDVFVLFIKIQSLHIFVHFRAVFIPVISEKTRCNSYSMVRSVVREVQHKE